MYEYQASLSVPVFTGGRIRSEIASSSSEIDRLQLEMTELQNRIALEVKTASTRMAAALQEVAVANSGLELAKQEVTEAQDRFAAGASDNVEVVTAQDALAGSYRDHIQALYEVNQARADLSRAGGKLEAVYEH